MNKIAPSILSADFSVLKEEIRRMEDGSPDLVHLDVMDGHFVPNLTFGPMIARAVKKLTKIPLDLHLMVNNPDFFISLFSEIGCEIITIHVEVCPNLHRSIQSIKEKNIKAGLAINPGTPLSFLDHILPDIDMVLLMSVNPGFGNQKYIPQVTDKIRQTRKLIEKSGRNIDLEVDGGIKVENIKAVADAGANVFVAGSAVFANKNGKSPELAIGEMRSALQ